MALCKNLAPASVAKVLPIIKALDVGVPPPLSKLSLKAPVA
jgi:hypothetical protein